MTSKAGPSIGSGSGVTPPATMSAIPQAFGSTRARRVAIPSSTKDVLAIQAARKPAASRPAVSPLRISGALPAKAGGDEQVGEHPSLLQGQVGEADDEGDEREPACAVGLPQVDGDEAPSDQDRTTGQQAIAEMGTRPSSG
jgi:hypothetical protein